MNDPIPVTTELKTSPFLPLALLAISLICVMVTNLQSTLDQQTVLKRQKDTQTPIVEQSRQVQARFQKMMMELLQLAQTDGEAKTVIAKYGIGIQPLSR